MVSREARLAIEAHEGGAARLTIVYRSLLPRQELRVTVNGYAPAPLELAGAGLKEAREVALDLALRSGVNEVALAFAAAVQEPGTGRQLVLLIERAEIG